MCVYDFFWLLLSLSSVFCFQIGSSAILTYSPGSCSVIPSNFSSTCSDVVDYSYFLPNTTSLSLIENSVNSKLSIKLFYILPQACQEAIKMVVCASAYQQCKPGVNLMDTSTYYNYGTTLYPAQRPCSFLCTAVAANCLGIYKCDSSVVTSSDSAICQSMSGKSITVAATKEKYVNASNGACSGITTELYVPPPFKVSPLLNQLPEPYVVQAFIENKLASSFKAIPSWVSEDCHLALRRMFCGSAFLRPERQDVGAIITTLGGGFTSLLKNSLLAQGYNYTALMAYSFFLPSYPHRSICLDYQAKCKFLISLRTSLNVDCNSTSEGIIRYPIFNQSVGNISIRVSALQTKTIYFMTSPNLMKNKTDKGYTSLPFTAPGKCVSMANYSSSATNICKDLVDYPFFLPLNRNFSEISAIALTKLSATGLTILPRACQAAIKTLVCASAFQQCKPNLDLTNLETYYVYDAYLSSANPYPARKPCTSICDTVAKTCLGLFKCDSTLVTSNDTAKCQSLAVQSSTLSSNIGNSKEPYLKASISSNGACSGIITGDIYIPPASKVSVLLNPLQKPYVIQTIIEKALATKFKAIPAWVSEDCHLAMRKLFCGSFLIKPEMQDLNASMYAIAKSKGIPVRTMTTMLKAQGYNISGLISYQLYLPSYPHYSVCTAYNTKCSDFIKLNSALKVDCDATVSGTTMYKYPKSRQVVGNMSLHISSSISTPVFFYTSPNTMADSTDGGYISKCPGRFVKPDNANNPIIRWVPGGKGSSCALPCRGLLWSENEWDFFDQVLSISSRVGLVLVLLLIVAIRIDCKSINILTMTSSCPDIFVFIFAIVSCVLSISFIAKSNDQGSQCSGGNAAQTVASDGANACTVQAALLWYCLLVGGLAWMSTCIELFIGFVLTQTSKKTQYITTRSLVSLTLILPLITLIYMVHNGQNGYDGNGVICRLSPAAIKNIDIYFFFLPLIVVTAISSLLLLGVLIKIVTVFFSDSRTPVGMSDSSGKTENSEKIVVSEKIKTSEEIVKTSENIRTHENSNVFDAVETADRVLGLYKYLGFVLLELLFFFSIILGRGEVYKSSDAILKAFTTWTACVFTNYDGVSDVSWSNVCGDRMDYNLDVNAQSWVTFCYAGQSVFVAAAALPFVLYSIWHKRKVHDGHSYTEVNLTQDENKVVEVEIVSLADKSNDNGNGCNNDANAHYQEVGMSSNADLDNNNTKQVASI